MKIARDFREIARKSLEGKWLIAIAVGLLASLLGGIGDNGPKLNLNFEGANVGLNLNFAGQNIFSLGGSGNSPIGTFLSGTILYFIVLALFLGALCFLLGGVIGVGNAKFNIELTKRQDVNVEMLFSYFKHYKIATLTKLLKSLYIFLWSLLLVIPGIIAGYSYAMTDYILAENPDISSSEALERSKQLMDGNRLRLFCLQFSFLGWKILAALTFGIGNLWVTPYMQAATAAFYLEICDEKNGISA